MNTVEIEIAVNKCTLLSFGRQKIHENSFAPFLLMYDGFWHLFIQGPQYYSFQVIIKNTGFKIAIDQVRYPMKDGAFTP